jgi:hypothetical protein
MFQKVMSAVVPFVPWFDTVVCIEVTKRRVLGKVTGKAGRALK